MATDDERWASQVGPVLTETDVATLVGIPVEALVHDDRYVRLVDRHGNRQYPVVQFDGREQVAGLESVLRALRQATSVPDIAAGLVIGPDRGVRRVGGRVRS